MDRMDESSSTGADPLVGRLIDMTSYEREVWDSLTEHWERRNNRRGLPNWAGTALERTGEVARNAATKVVDSVPESIKEPVRRAGDAVSSAALKPTLEGAIALLNLVNDWAVELNSPTSVEKLARKRGVDLDSFADLRHQDLKFCDRLLSRNTLAWRSAGAFEGGAMGLLAMVPVAGIPLSLTADVLVIQVLSVAIASHVAYSYGFDAKDPGEQLFIERLVRRSFVTQAAKAKPLTEVARAAEAIKDRVNWSGKLRDDHRLLGAIEKLLQQLGPAGSRVSVKSVAKVVPFLGVFIGAGANSAVLGGVAADAKRYCQTRSLCEKYDLPFPAALARYERDDDLAPEAL